MDPKPWSYSSLSTFVQCAYKYYRTQVTRDAKELPSPEMQRGTEDHKSFENYVSKGTPLPLHLKPHQEFVDRMNSDLLPGERIEVERKVALNKKLEPTGFFAPDVWWRGILDWTRYTPLYESNLTRAKIIDYKGLPVSEVVATPEGFRAIGDLAVGDLVFARDGQAYPVTAKSRQSVKECYRVTFTDKTSVVCDAEHLWPLDTGKVVGVQDLKLRVSAVPVPEPVAYSEKALPIDPYVFGLWLADGKHTSGEISKPDDFVFEECARRGYKVGENISSTNSCPTRTVYGIRGHLQDLGVLRNKHIPEVYLQGSIAQRVDLLRGLMDGDGTVNPVRKQVVFTNTNEALSLGVKRLVESLGMRCSMALTVQQGYGLIVNAYPVSWRPRKLNPFLLPRKASLVQDWGDGKSASRQIFSVERVEDQLTQCISVASPDHTYLCTRDYLVTHNTGKYKEDTKQNILGSLYLFREGVDLVDSRYYWTQGKVDKPRMVLGRNEQKELWTRFEPDLRQYYTAFKQDIWQKRPSALCSWCPVTDCEHWRKRK